MKLHIKSFATLADVTIDFPSTGIVHVTGNNGSGKSGIVDAIEWCLWGTTPRGTVPQDPVVTLEASSVKIRRTDTTAYKDNERLTRTELTKSNSSVFGDSKLWRMTRLLSAQSASRLTAATPAVRTSVLEELLDIEDIPRYQASLKSIHILYTNTLKNKEQEACQHRGAKAALERDIAELDAILARPVETAVGAPVEPPGVALLPAAILARERALERRLEASTALRNARALMGGRCPTCGAEKPSGIDPAVLAGTEREYAEANAEEVKQTGLVRLYERQCSDFADLVRVRSLEASKRSDGLNTRSRRVDKLSEVRHLIAQLDEEADKARELASTCEFLYKQAGNVGYKAYMLSALCNDLTESADYWLKKLCTGTDISLTIRIEDTAQKSSVEILTSIDGIEKPYEACSSGQQRRINLAVMLGMSSLDRTNRFGWSPLFVDEVLDTLDADGRHAAFECLQEIAETRCVFLVSHVKLPAQPDMVLRVDGGKVSVEQCCTMRTS